VIALLGLAFSLSGLLIIGFRIFMTAQQSQEAFIQLRYGALLVNVHGQDFAPASVFIDVTAIDELAKLAERHNTVILHMTLNFLHCYMVQCSGTTYRYMFSAGKRGIPEIEPQHQQLAQYVIHVTENNVLEAIPDEEGLFGYAVNKSRAAKAEATEAVMLRKLRL